MPTISEQTEFAAELQPWLSRLKQDPRAAVDELWAGSVERHPYARASLSEFIQAVVPMEPIWTDRLDEGIHAWLVARRQDELAARKKFGLNSYVLDLCEALAVVHLMGLRRSAFYLHDQRKAFERWLAPLVLGEARDPLLEFWRLLALCQVDTGLIALWVQFVRYSGENSSFHWPSRYLTLGLRGLRGMPNQRDDRFNLRALLAALALRAADQFQIEGRQEVAIKEFVQLWGQIRTLYPRDPTFWQALQAEVLRALSLDLSAKRSLEQGLIGQVNRLGRDRHAQSGAVGLYEPPKALFDQANHAIAKFGPRQSYTALQAVLHNRLDFAKAVGDSYYFIRTLSNLGTRWLATAGLAEADLIAKLEQLTRDGLELEPSNPYVWMLWVSCLRKTQRFDIAELVLWDMRRRFPDNAPCRVDLARLLMYGAVKRFPEAEALLSEAVSAAPDDKPNRLELARLYMYGPDKRFEQAEVLLRSIAASYQDDEPCRIELSHLLVHQRRAGEAIALLEKFEKDGFDSELVRTRQTWLKTPSVVKSEFDRAWERVERDFSTNGLIDPDSGSSNGSVHEPQSVQYFEMADLERAVFSIGVGIRGGRRALAIDPAMKALDFYRLRADGPADLAQSHWCWLAHKSNNATNAPLLDELRILFPGSYVAQITALWLSESATDNDWKSLNSRFYTRHHITLFLRLMRHLWHGHALPDKMLQDFRRWQNSISSLGGADAKESNDVRLARFLGKQLETRSQARAVDFQESVVVANICHSLVASFAE